MLADRGNQHTKAHAANISYNKFLLPRFAPPWFERLQSSHSPTSALLEAGNVGAAKDAWKAAEGNRSQTLWDVCA